MRRALPIVTLLLAFSCGSSGGPEAIAPAARVEAQDDSPVAGFVLYEFETSTIVPVEADHAAVRAVGTWWLDPEDPTVAVQEMLPEVAADVGLPPCPCTQLEHACINQLVERAFARDGVTQRTECACWGDAGTPAPELPEYLGSREEPAPCAPVPAPPEHPISFVSGVFYTMGSDSTLEDECGNEGSYNVWDAWATDSALWEGAPRAASSVTAPWTACTLAGLGDTLIEEGAIASAPPCTRESAEQEQEQDEYGDLRECSRCLSEEPDGAYPLIVSGQLCAIDFNMSAAGEEIAWARCQPLRPDSCPSPWDPCGDPEPFGAALEEDGGRFWVSTDGRWALTDSGVLHSRDGNSREIEEAATVPIGVLYYEDVRPILDAIELASTPDPRSGPESSGRCESDDACAWRGLCGAVCREDGQCSAAPTGACTDDFPCDEPFVCSPESTCVLCLEDSDCEDAICESYACVDPECDEYSPCPDGETCRAGRCAPALRCGPGASARELGNRCAQRMRAREWPEAQRLCECALAANPGARSEGAILYNLGRIAEGRGDRDAARGHYRRSLERRPSAIVRARLESLE